MRSALRMVSSVRAQSHGRSRHARPCFKPRGHLPAIQSAPEGSGSIGEQQKEPVLQLFVNPVGLPKRRGMRVVVESDDRQEDDEPLGATQRSDHRDHRDSIELWDQASGKDGSVQLRFLVKAWRDDVPDKEETLAIASIRGDELRRFGLYNPREGAAVALPLYTSSGEQLPLELGRHAEPHNLRSIATFTLDTHVANPMPARRKLRHRPQPIPTLHAVYRTARRPKP